MVFLAVDGELSKIWLNGSQLKKSDGFAIPLVRETDERSITPTTFRSMHLVENPTLVDEVATEKATIEGKKVVLEVRKKSFLSVTIESITRLKAISNGIVDEPLFSHSEVSLAALSKGFDGKINQYQQYLLELEQFATFVGNIGLLPLTFMEEYQAEGSHISISRFGINTAHLGGNVGEDLSKIYINTDKGSAISVSTAGTKKKVDIYPHLMHPLEIF